MADSPGVFRTIARSGVDPFYNGFIAEQIAAAVQGDLHIPGDMTVDDLMRYEVIERAPVCIDYRGYQVRGMGPPPPGSSRGTWSPARRTTQPN